MIKKLAILNSGGDAPGMNNAVKALVNSAISKGIKPYLVYEGYLGLVENNIIEAKKETVKFIGTQGGTIIYSARLPEFKEESVRKKAVKNLKAKGIDALAVVGGDGSYMGAAKLKEMGINTIGLPGTIDNDISSTDFTIGYHTALNTIVEQIDKIRDTSESHKRANIVEVMGRYCGDLAINAALATGAEVLSVPEEKLSEKEIINQVKEARKNKNRSIIIIVTELMYDVSVLAKKIEKETKVETRATTLGHAQRGGSPTAEDRILATSMGKFAIDKLIEGETGVAINIVNNKLETKDILEVVEMKRPSKKEILEIYNISK